MNTGAFKRYWLFCGGSFYPDGGMDDFANSFDSQEEAERAGINLCGLEGHRPAIFRGREEILYRPDWYMVLDMETAMIVAGSSKRKPYPQKIPIVWYRGKGDG